MSAVSQGEAELEAAIKAQGNLVERLYARGLTVDAREAFEIVRRLVALRTPETVAALEQQRGLR